MNTTTLLTPLALVAGFFATTSQAHDVVVAASIPGISIVIGNPAPVYVAPAPVYVEPAPVYVEPAPTYVVYRPAPRATRVVYRRPPPPPVVVVERPRYVDVGCGHDNRDSHWNDRRDDRDHHVDHRNDNRGNGKGKGHDKGHGKGQGHPSNAARDKHDDRGHQQVAMVGHRR